MKPENTPDIETNRLILRKFTKNDFNDLMKIISDKEVNKFLPWFPLETENEAKDFLKNKFLNYYDKQTAYKYAVCLKENNKPIGYVWLSNDDSHDFGYGLRKEFWNKGFITEASKAVVKKIKAAGYSYITATHDINNPASARVMKKLGMKYCYSYVEQWQPKNIQVTFRLYQLNFDGDENRVYMNYWNRYENHFIEKDLN